MSGKMQVIGEVVREYLLRFPDHPSKTIARILFEREPKLFQSIEHARGVVRYYRGADGTKKLARANKSNLLLREKGRPGDDLARLPSPLPDGPEWKIVQVSFRRALIIGDIHLPYHDVTALDIALKHGKSIGVDCIIINGDLMDCYAVSFWEKDPRLRDFAMEVEMGKRFLEVLRDRFPKAQIWYKEGNHEERLWRYVAKFAPELFGLRDGAGREMFNLSTLLDCDEYGVKVVDNKQPIRCGEHLHVLHGHEFRAPFTNPVNPARGLYLRAKCNAICGDLHQTSQHTETGLTHTVSCWSHGMLCWPHPRYAPLNRWNTGFATVEISRDSWLVENRKIIKGKIV